MRHGLRLLGFVAVVVGVGTSGCRRTESNADESDTSIAGALRATRTHAPPPPRTDGGNVPVVRVPAAPSVPPWAVRSCGLVPSGMRNAEQVFAVARDVSARAGDDLVVQLAAEEYRLRDPAMTLEAVERNPERFRCHFAVFEGDVLEIRDIPEGGSLMRLGLGRGLSAIAVFSFVAPNDAVVRGTRARVYGFGGGEFTYRTALGGELAIPRLDAIVVVPASVERHPSQAMVDAVVRVRAARDRAQAGR